MFIKKSKIDKLLGEDMEGNDNAENHNSLYLYVFYASIVLTIFVAFIEIKLLLLTLFAPTIIVFIINPPMRSKFLFRLLSLIYLLFLISVTVLWYVR